MLDFTYYVPTRIDFGRGSLDRLEQELAEIKAHHVLILYGGSFLEKSGVLDSVVSVVRSAGCKVTLRGGIMPNPTISSVEAISAEIIDDDVNLVLAVGGGSVIDSAKAVAALLATSDLSLEDLIMNRSRLKRALPVGVVLTLAGSGSESSAFSVLTMDEGQLKRSFSSDLLRPRFAIMDPTLTFSLPRYQMVSGSCDILMHAMERYFSPTPETELIDRMAEGLMEAVINAIRRSVSNPEDYEARATLMWAGSLAHNGLLGTGRQEDWACHRLEHELSGLFGVVHGAGLCAVWGSWASYVQPSHPKRFASFARRVLHLGEELADDEAGRLGIARLVAFFREVGMPTSLEELSDVVITDNVIERMASNCLLTQETIGGLMPLGHDDICAIYREAVTVCDS